VSSPLKCAIGAPTTQPPTVPLLHRGGMIDGQAAAYVCDAPVQGAPSPTSPGDRARGPTRAAEGPKAPTDVNQRQRAMSPVASQRFASRASESAARSSLCLLTSAITRWPTPYPFSRPSSSFETTSIRSPLKLSQP